MAGIETSNKRGMKRVRSEVAELGEVVERMSSAHTELQNYLTSSGDGDDDDYKDKTELKLQLLRQVAREMVVKRKLDAMLDHTSFIKMRIRGAVFKGIDATWEPEWIAAVAEMLNNMTVEPNVNYNGGNFVYAPNNVTFKFYGNTKDKYSGFDLIRAGRPTTTVDLVYDPVRSDCSNYQHLVKVASILSVKILPVNLWFSLLARIYREFGIDIKQGWYGALNIPSEDTRFYFPSQHFNTQHAEKFDLAQGLDRWIAPRIKNKNSGPWMDHRDGRVKFYTQIFLPIIVNQLKIIVRILFPDCLLKRQAGEKLLRDVNFYTHKLNDLEVSSIYFIEKDGNNTLFDITWDDDNGKVLSLKYSNSKTSISADEFGAYAITNYSPLSSDEFKMLIAWGSHCSRENNKNIEKCLQDEMFPSLDDHFAKFLQSPDQVDNARLPGEVAIRVDELRGKLTDTNVWKAVQEHQLTVDQLQLALDDQLPAALIQIVNCCVELVIPSYTPQTAPVVEQ